jgi:hypothetical protein
MTLLERLLPSQDVNSLLGDIDEESRHRSSFWYWGQIAAAIVVGSYREVRKHPFQALRAIGVGLVITLVVVVLLEPALTRVARVLSEGAGYHIGTYWLTLPSNAFRYFPALVNVLAFTASGGWIARSDRARGITMVLPWTLLVCGLPAYAIIDFLTYQGPSIVWTGPRTIGLMSSLSLPAWVLVGGALAVTWRRTAYLPPDRAGK